MYLQIQGRRGVGGGGLNNTLNRPMGILYTG